MAQMPGHGKREKRGGSRRYSVLLIEEFVLGEKGEVAGGNYVRKETERGDRYPRKKNPAKKGEGKTRQFHN